MTEHITVDAGPHLAVASLADRLRSRERQDATIRRLAVTCGLGASLFLFFVLFVLSPNAIRPPDPLTWQSVTALAAVCLLGGAITGLWVWGEVRFSSRRARASAARFIGVYAIGGLVVEIILEALLPLTGFISVVPPAVRLLTAITVAPWMAVIVGLTYDGWTRVRAERNALVQRAARLALSQASQAAFLDELRIALHRDVESELAPKFDESRMRLAEQESLDRAGKALSAVEILRELNESSVRPFSKRLARQSRQARRPIWVLAFITGVARFQSFRPGAVSGIFMLTVVADRWTSSGLEAALATAISGVGLIFLILGTANVLMRRLPTHHAAIFVVAFFVLQVPTLAVELVVGAQVTPAYLVHALVSILMSGCVVWLTSGIGRWRSPQAELLRIYSDELDAARITLLARAEIIASMTQQAARYLHGAVQSKLTACIASLELAAARQDDEAYSRAIIQARLILTEARMPVLVEPANATLTELVHAKVALWQGIANITVFVSASIGSVTGEAARTIGDIVEEGICNAIRHGEAPNISIAVNVADFADGPGIMVLVVDDGTGLRDVTPGLGMAMLDDTCPDRWRLIPNPGGGSTLEATMSLPAPNV
ncbi:MAG: hypothetical protein KGP12_03745 [Actinomycetales bacterium]|nr:hypothetical protein [Actinomycetales bacterium]